LSKIEILQVGPYPEWDEGPLNDQYTMHRYFEADDKPGLLRRKAAGLAAHAARARTNATPRLQCPLHGARPGSPSPPRPQGSVARTLLGRFSFCIVNNRMKHLRHAGRHQLIAKGAIITSALAVETCRCQCLPRSCTRSGMRDSAEVDLD